MGPILSHLYQSLLHNLFNTNFSVTVLSINMSLLYSKLAEQNSVHHAFFIYLIRAKRFANLNPLTVLIIQCLMKRKFKSYPMCNFEKILLISLFFL
jgi:hypothetical protein